MMVKIFAVILLGISTVKAEKRIHIEDMAQPEQCVYAAKLGAAASWIRLQKLATSCDTIKYIWHGDETEFEIDFIKRVGCNGFMMNLDPMKTGDSIYKQCMEERRI